MHSKFLYDSKVFFVQHKTFLINKTYIYIQHELFLSTCVPLLWNTKHLVNISFVATTYFVVIHIILVSNVTSI